MAKQIKARMTQKIDTYENWLKATGFIPMEGEIILVSDFRHPTVVGDGISSAAELVTAALQNQKEVPTKISELENDSGYLVEEIDPTVPAWAKTATKPTYTASEVKAVSYEAQTLTEAQKSQARSNIGAGDSTFSGDYDDLENKPAIPDALADLTSDATHRTVTDAEKATWNAKSNFSGSYNDLTDKPTYTADSVGAVSKTEYDEHYHSTTYTPQGSIKINSFTPAGSVSQPNFTGAATNVKTTVTPSGKISTGTGTANYAPSGSVSAPTVTVTPNTTSIQVIDSVGSLPSADLNQGELPSLTFSAGTLPSASLNKGSLPTHSFSAGTLATLTHSYDSTNKRVTLSYTQGTLPSSSFTQGSLPSLTFNAGTLPNATFDEGVLPSLTFNAGSLPTKKSAMTVATGIKSAIATAPSFTGTGVELKFTGTQTSYTSDSFTPAGTVSKPTFNGTAGTPTGSFTGTAATITTTEPIAE